MKEKGGKIKVCEIMEGGKDVLKFIVISKVWKYRSCFLLL